MGASRDPSTPEGVRHRIWEHLNREGGPFTELRQLDGAAAERLRSALVHHPEVSVEAWLATEKDEVSSLFRCSGGWVLLDGFSGPRGHASLLTLKAQDRDSLRELRDAVLAVGAIDHGPALAGGRA